MMDGSRPRGEGGPGTGVQTRVMGVNWESRYAQAGGTLFKFIRGGSNEGNRRVLRESLYVGGREKGSNLLPSLFQQFIPGIEPINIHDDSNVHPFRLTL